MCSVSREFICETAQEKIKLTQNGRLGRSICWVFSDDVPFEKLMVCNSLQLSVRRRLSVHLCMLCSCHRYFAEAISGNW